MDPAIDLKEEGYKPRNDKDAYNYELCKYTQRHCETLPNIVQTNQRSTEKLRSVFN